MKESNLTKLISFLAHVDDEPCMEFPYEDFTETLSPFAKKWFSSAIAGAITLGGIPKDFSSNYFELATSFSDDEEQLSSNLNNIREEKLPKLGQLRGQNREHAFKMFLVICKLSLKKSTVSPKGLEFQKNIASKLGFTSDLHKRSINLIMELMNTYITDTLSPLDHYHNELNLLITKALSIEEYS